MEEEEQQQQQEQEQEQEPEKEGRGREGVRLFGVRRIPFISKETYYTCVKRDLHMFGGSPSSPEAFKFRRKIASSLA